METWRPIPGWEGRYEASDRGRIRSVFRQGVARTGRVLRPAFAKCGGYPQVALCRDGVQRTEYVHRLVLTAFVGPCPEGMEAAHADGDPSNNAASNLAWKVHVDNEADKVRHGTLLLGTARHNARLNERLVRAMRRLAAEGVSQQDIAEQFGVALTTAHNVVRRKTWAHVA